MEISEVGLHSSTISCCPAEVWPLHSSKMCIAVLSFALYWASMHSFVDCSKLHFLHFTSWSCPELGSLLCPLYSIASHFIANIAQTLTKQRPDHPYWLLQCFCPKQPCFFFNSWPTNVVDQPEEVPAICKTWIHQNFGGCGDMCWKLRNTELPKLGDRGGAAV